MEAPIVAAGAVVLRLPVSDRNRHEVRVHAVSFDVVYAACAFVDPGLWQRRIRRTMAKPCIISVAITGSLPRKKDNPAVPITLSEQVESTHAAFEAGATLVHLHVRNDDETRSRGRFRLWRRACCDQRRTRANRWTVFSGSSYIVRNACHIGIEKLQIRRVDMRS